jgi:homogentisate phytyltransferase/homogentisate geranylgeranyltransferase
MSQVSPKSSAAVCPTPLHFTKHPRSWLYAFWKFSRPHTIIGTSLSVWSVFAIAALSTPPGIGPDLTYPLIKSLLPTLMACLCGNVYIVGLNQLEDVQIDRINKPHLPLASGEFSRQQGIRIVSLMGVLSLVIAALQGSYLLGMVAVSLLIGTAYSLPPIRLKRFPFWASVCIFTVRGVVVNLGLFLHFNQGFPIPATVWLLTLFIVVFTIAIALFKDIPDIEGDRQYQISTFTLRLGASKIFGLTRWIITSCYMGLILAATLGVPGVNAPLLISTHLAAIALFWWRSLQVDLKNKASISRFYQFIWKLFFLEYLLFPLICFSF